MTRVRGKRTLIFAYCVMFFTFLGLGYPSLEGSSSREPSRTMLVAPTESTSLETLSRGARGMMLHENKLWVIPKNHTHATLANFDPRGQTRDKVFGTFESLQKPMLMNERDKDLWVHLRRTEAGNYLAFDGRNFAWIEMDPDQKEILRRSVAWDLVRPPRDRGGEATQGEIREFRRRFSLNWQTTLGHKASGVAKAVDRWVGAGKKNTFLVSLRVREFPLVLMECDPNDPSQCQLTRGCFVEGTPIEPSALTGIAVSHHRNLVLMGDSRGGVIRGYRFHSCFHVTHEKTWVLPATLKKLSNISVDEDDRLWVSTEDPDDYLNGSVFYWNRDLW